MRVAFDIVAEKINKHSIIIFHPYESFMVRTRYIHIGLFAILGFKFKTRISFFSQRPGQLNHSYGRPSVVAPNPIGYTVGIAKKKIVSSHAAFLELSSHMIAHLDLQVMLLRAFSSITNEPVQFNKRLYLNSQCTI